MDGQEREKRIKELAKQVLQLARDEVILNLRFLDAAAVQLSMEQDETIDGMACDGRKLFYAPAFVLRAYQKENKRIVRTYLHSLLHFLFYHSFHYDKLDRELWDMAADAAVENVILELASSSFSLKTDDHARQRLRMLKADAGGLTAERLYRYWKQNGIGTSEKAALSELFHRDEHFLWKEQERLLVTKGQWQKIQERVKTDTESFAGEAQRMESIGKNLREAGKERYDYQELLRRFTVMGENVRINEEEFDYVYYTYGLSCYGNVPLIEPLEYKEECKIKEFVIALDTSASCRGSLVRAFLKRTYDILKGTENFFQKINVHILQCDHEVQSDTKITGQSEFDRFLEQGNLKGFGGTDFRPVFAYIDSLRRSGEFENLKGLIYFTDGYGLYPEQMPDYDVIFAFAYCGALVQVALPHTDITFEKGAFLQCTGLEVMEAPGFGAQTAALLAAVVCKLDAPHLLTLKDAGTAEWLEKWDAGMLLRMKEEDKTGYSKTILGGEEDYGSMESNLDAFLCEKRRSKVRLALVRLRYSEGLLEETRAYLQNYLRTYTKGCASEESWLVVKEEYGAKTEYCDLLYQAGALTRENYDAVLRDMGSALAEPKAYLLRKREEWFPKEDVFAGFVL